jgi:hypothetical protein
MSRRIAHNGWPPDRTRVRRCNAMNERLPGGTRRASPAAVSNPALRHHRPCHRSDDTYPDDHARPARTEQAARGAADQDARATSDRHVQPAVTTGGSLPRTTNAAVSGTRLDRRLTAPSDDAEQPGPASSDACFATAKRAYARGRSTLSEVVPGRSARPAMTRPLRGRRRRVVVRRFGRCAPGISRRRSGVPPARRAPSHCGFIWRT